MYVNVSSQHGALQGGVRSCRCLADQGVRSCESIRWKGLLTFVKELSRTRMIQFDLSGY